MRHIVGVCENSGVAMQHRSGAGGNLGGNLALGMAWQAAPALEAGAEAASRETVNCPSERRLAQSGGGT